MNAYNLFLIGKDVVDSRVYFRVGRDMTQNEKVQVYSKGKRCWTSCGVPLRSGLLHFSHPRWKSHATAQRFGSGAYFDRVDKKM